MNSVTKAEDSGRTAKEQSENEELRSSLNRLMEATVAWKVERTQLLSECEQMRQALNGNEEAAAIALERQIATSVERIRAELKAENDRLRQELQQVGGTASDWAGERSKLQAEIDHTRQLMGYAEEAAAIALQRQLSTALEKVKAEHAAENEKLQGRIRQLETERNQIQESMTSLQNSQRLAAKESEKNAAAAEQRIADALEKARAEFSTEREQLREELNAAIQLSAQRASECARLTAERDRAQQSAAERAEAQREVESAIERVRAELGAESDALRRQWESDRQRLESELDRQKAALTKAEVAWANALTDSETTERKNSKLMEDCVRLRQELEKTSDSAAQKDIERDRLKEECERAHKMLEEAKSAQATPPDSNSILAALQAEQARVEQGIQELAAVIDDPNTELSVVIRKTVERAQQDAYLKGLRYASTGQ
jgi:colicin import membrane protein